MSSADEVRKALAILVAEEAREALDLAVGKISEELAQIKSDWSRVSVALVHDRDRHDKDIKELRIEIGGIIAGMETVTTQAEGTNVQIGALAGRVSRLLLRIQLLVDLNGGGSEDGGQAPS